MTQHPHPSHSALPEITDPESLPTYPLCRYYIADCPSEETENWVEAKTTAEAAQMAQTLFGSNWGRFALVAWQSQDGEVRRFAPRMEDALSLLAEELDRRQHDRPSPLN